MVIEVLFLCAQYRFINPSSYMNDILNAYVHILTVTVTQKLVPVFLVGDFNQLSFYRLESTG